MRRNYLSLPLMAAFMLQTMACGKDTEEEAQGPALPPADSMELQAFTAGDQSTALTIPTGTKVNAGAAALSVGLVTLAINIVLIIPKAIFAGVLTEKPKYNGEEWIWKHTYPLLAYDAELHGSVKDKLELSMHMTGLKDQNDYIQDYVWYTGSHGLTSGTWQFYDPGTESEPGPTVPVLTIDWSRVSATEKKLIFTNTRPDVPEKGDTITYELDGNIASMEIVDKIDNQDATTTFTVVWSVADGSGKIEKNDETLCWDTLENDQVDIICPDDDWPVP
ncbi:MAG: hypothetical protein JW841_13195 [Deltaproteobacteria bacterium]|nr:hypothetical protein [Deltaproteobacteria bacterium]